MAKYWLINTVSFANSGKHLPGDVVDDMIDNVQQYINAGAVLWPFADSIVADAAAKCQVSRISKAVNEQELFNLMNAACNDSLLLTGQNKSPNTSQPIWYIKPTGGNDNASGKTANAALKTWAEWRRRVGQDSTLTPAGGLLTITILGDMPQTDPILFTNRMAPNCSAIIQGVEKAITQPRFITSALDEDPLADQYWAITDSALSSATFFTQHIGRIVKITSGLGAGSKAFICRDAADLPAPQTSVPKTAHMSNWMAGDFFTFDFGPGQQPNETSKYQIVDYPVAYYGQIQSRGTKFVTDPNAIQSVLVKNLRFEYSQTAPYQVEIGGVEADGGLIHQECIFHVNLLAMSMSRNLYMANCSMQGNVQVERGWYQMIGGVHQPQPSVPESGGLDVLYGGEYVFLGANPTFVGKNLGGSDRIDASINGMGVVHMGQVSVWDSFHTLLTQPGGRANLGAGDFFFGDPWTGNFGVVPIWGKGNVTAILAATNSEIVVSQFQVGVPVTSPWNLPRVQSENTGWDFEAWSPAFDGTNEPGKFFKLDPATGIPSGTKHIAKFADFQLDGFFQCEAFTSDPNYHQTMSRAQSPMLRTTVTFGLGIFNP